MKDRYDAVVIGAGHNGLVCAAYLARGGLSVCVLERHTSIGGAAVTEEFHPGFRNSAASYTVGLLRQKVLDDLALEKHGLKLVPRPLANFVPAIAGPGLELDASVSATQAAIAAHSRSDAERYPEFAKSLSRVTRVIESFLLEPPMDPSGSWREKLAALGKLRRLRQVRREDWSAIWTLLTGSAGDWLDAWFDNDLLKGALGFDSVVGHFSSPYAAGSGYLLLHHCLGDLKQLAGSWGHAIGGMGAVSVALADSARAAGAEIRCECAVDNITPTRGGFELSIGGRRMRAGVVAGAIHPRLLFCELIDAGLLPAEFVARIRAWRSESATYRANVALSELPDFTCLPGRNPARHHAAGIIIAPSLSYLADAHGDALAEGVSRKPIVEILIPSTIDDSLAPPGAHVASLFCQHFRYGLPQGESWDTARDTALERIIDTVTEYAPNFRRSVLAAKAYSPPDLERRFALVGGDIFHGVMSLDQLYWARPAFGHAQYRSPLPGLYMCGSGTHPGGGVTGAPGHNAAQTILRDLGRRRQSANEAPAAR